MAGTRDMSTRCWNDNSPDTNGGIVKSNWADIGKRRPDGCVYLWCAVLPSTGAEGPRNTSVLTMLCSPLLLSTDWPKVDFLRRIGLQPWYA